MVSNGFGKTEVLVSSKNLVSIQKVGAEAKSRCVNTLIKQLSYASDFFFLFTNWAAKCSMALLFVRLTPRKDHKRVAQGILLAITVWLVVSILITALRCDLARPWIFINPKCDGAVCSFCRYQVPANPTVGRSLGCCRSLRYRDRNSPVRDVNSPGERPQDGCTQKGFRGNVLWPTFTVCTDLCTPISERLPNSLVSSLP